MSREIDIHDYLRRRAHPTGGELDPDLLCSRLGDVAAQVAVADIDEDVGRELTVLGADGGRAACEL